MSDNVIQMKDWIRSPAALKGIDRQIQDLFDKFEDLLESKEENLDDLDQILQWAIDYKLPLQDPDLKESLKQFAESICLEEKIPNIHSFDTIIKLIESLDELIIEKVMSITDKRLESLRLKWDLIVNNKPLIK